MVNVGTEIYGRNDEDVTFTAVALYETSKVLWSGTLHGQRSVQGHLRSPKSSSNDKWQYLDNATATIEH